MTARITANNGNLFQRRGVYSSAAFKSGKYRDNDVYSTSRDKSNIIKSKKVKGEINTSKYRNVDSQLHSGSTND